MMYFIKLELKTNSEMSEDS